MAAGLPDCVGIDIYSDIRAFAVPGIRSEPTADLDDGDIADQLTNPRPRLADDSALLL